MSHARTCVVTINYKGASDTVACITSLHTSSVPVSIVVVDNTPDDPDLIDALKSYPEVKLIRAPENLGFGRGNNLGIEWALRNSDCEFIFIFNNDATVERETIEKLQRVMDERPTSGIATGRIVLSENPEILWYGGGEIDWRRGGAIIPGIMQPSDGQLPMRSREVGFASGCAMLIRRTVIVDIGVFDPVFFMYEEDVDLSLRVRENYSIYYDSSALMFHKGQGSQRKPNESFQGKWSASNQNYSFHVYHMTRNSVINARKHAKGKDKLTWLIFYPLFLLKKTMKVSIHLGFAGFKPAFAGVIDGMKIKV